jgi:curli production assembly/transport component CsgF
LSRTFVSGLAAVCSIAAAGSAASQDMVYTPVNPSFGGNPFNSSHLLGVAGAQNTYKDPDALSTKELSQSEQFARQLQSRLLSALSSQLTDAIFGDNARDSGTISFGGQTVDFSRDLENITINVTDDATGEVTKIVVPVTLAIQ